MLLSTLHQLGLDSTVFIQFVIAIIGLPLVSFVLVRPLFVQYEEREKVTHGFRKSAESMTSKAGELEKNYFDQIGLAQRTAKGKLDSIVTVANEECKTLLAQARTQSTQKIESFRKAAEAEATTVRSRLQGQTQALVQSIVEKLIS